MKKIRIASIRTERAIDDNPDLSWLGEYGAHEGNYTINRADRGDQGWMECRYWEPGPNHVPPGDPDNWGHCTDEDIQQALNTAGLPPILHRTDAIRILDEHYIEQDYQRCEAYNRGSWCMLGIIAKASICTPSGILQTIRSGGLWGIESDSDPEYLRQVEDEELAQLATDLESLGFGKRAIAFAMRRVERASN